MDLQQIVALARHPVTAKSKVAITTHPYDAMAKSLADVMGKHLSMQCMSYNRPISNNAKRQRTDHPLFASLIFKVAFLKS